MRCQGGKDSPAKGVSHLVPYGIEGKQSDVDYEVYDARSILEIGKIAFMTDIEVRDPIDPQNPVTKKFLHDYLKPVFFFCGDLVHDNKREVKIAATLTSSSSCQIHHTQFAIVNNEIVLKKSGIYEIQYADSYLNSSIRGTRVSHWFRSTNIS